MLNQLLNKTALCAKVEISCYLVLAIAWRGSCCGKPKYFLTLALALHTFHRKVLH